jgi:steroid delta-isomerase-like uncharacterized protein
MPAHLPSPEANVALIRASIGEFNANDIDACAARLTPDFVIHLAELPEPLHGPDVWREGVAIIRRGIPDLRAQIDDIFGAGDRVAVRVTFRGTHTGEYLGFAATGRPIHYVSHEFYRLADGLIAEEWICSDTATLVRQLT